MAHYRRGVFYAFTWLVRRECLLICTFEILFLILSYLLPITATTFSSRYYNGAVRIPVTVSQSVA